MLTQFLLRQVHKTPNNLVKIVRLDRIESIEQTDDANVTIICMMSGDSFEVVGHYENIKDKVRQHFKEARKNDL